MRDPTFKEMIEPLVRHVVAEMQGGPLLISQHNCVAVMGISVRAHLDNCRRPDFGPRVIRTGKLRLVDAAEYRAWLGRIDEGPRRPVTPSSEPADEAESILREFGFHPTTNTVK